MPDAYAATAVGLGFLVATYAVALRRDHALTPDHYGLSLGGLLDPEPLSARRMLLAGLRATAWALGLALLIFPAFWFGYLWWWKPRHAFVPGALPSFGDDVLGQLLVIALPEEAFYRGYLQTALDDVWKPRFRVLGADIGLGLLVSSALFALGHFATEVHPNRLAVFFPALVFGWLRARTKGVGAGIVFHALCNLFAAFLARSYGLGH
ncbi:MAG: CPBP family intramembrane metalloprotease [Myxococcales bacterium]|nr:CPBP family intramembrane metalloprotease [Myxococcales bacterium]